MLRFDREARSLMRLSAKPLSEAGVLERSDLQRMICNAPAQFFAELGEEFLQIGEEIRPSEVVDDRIDVLAIDPTGAAVIRASDSQVAAILSSISRCSGELERWAIIRQSSAWRR